MNNPLINADIPDPDVIFAKGWYYMTSTTMHLTPGVPVMRSRDLVSWEIVSYVYDVLENDPSHNLQEGRSIYGGGSWASSLRFHNEMFYVCFASNNTQKTYIYRTADIVEGPWERFVLEKLHHDPSLFFDSDGRAYIVYGNGEIFLKELSPDTFSPIPGKEPQNIISITGDNFIVAGEGSHVYAVEGFYYIFIIQWPRDGLRTQLCFRSEKLTGPYECKTVLADDMGYHNHGVAQGGIVQTPEGSWYSMLFQDHDAVGRIPVLIPVRWEDDWPVFGTDNKVPATINNLPDTQHPPENAVLSSDNFTSDTLNVRWQWNHNPDNNNWSLTDRPGFLRLRSGSTAQDILSARNVLSQRTAGPRCSASVRLDFDALQPGDCAGIAAFQNRYGYIGVKKSIEGDTAISLCMNDPVEGCTEYFSAPMGQSFIYLAIDFDFRDSIDTAEFSYSLDGSSWTVLDMQLKMKYTLDHFMGYRIALFLYAAEKTGGHADFSSFKAKIIPSV